jgi:uncharacterized membrane protein
MMASQTVDRYFERLERELADLPPERRRELMEEIRDHVDQSLSSHPDPTEADVRNVLDRLGDPAEIASEARERFGVRRVRASRTDWAAVFLLPFGGLLVLVVGTLGALGWVLGVVLLLISRVFSPRDKTIGVLLFPGGLLLPLLLLTQVGEVCSATSVNGRNVTSCTGFTLPPIIGIPLLIALILTPLIVAVHLGSKLRARDDERV